jgi:hypothetical protein
VKAVEFVVPMTMVHLLELSSKFVEFWVLMFRSLSVKVTHRIQVRRTIPVHALVLVILNMEHGNTDTKVGDQISNLWKVGDEAFMEMDAV